jgi:Ni/Co efflux regulator RcnB
MGKIIEARDTRILIFNIVKSRNRKKVNGKTAENLKNIKIRIAVNRKKITSRKSKILKFHWKNNKIINKMWRRDARNYVDWHCTIT